MKKILALAANPEDYTLLKLGREVRAIMKALQAFNRFHDIGVEQLHEVHKADLSSSLLLHQPYMLHFCGDGEEDGIFLVDENGHADRVGIEGMTSLLKEYSQDFPLHGVVFNSCYSDPMAASISNHVPYVVGMSRAISDKAAVKFANGFYEAIGAGLSPARAFHYGRSAIRLFELPGHLTPVLKCNEGLIDAMPREKKALKITLEGDVALFEREGKLRFFIGLLALALGIEKQYIKVLKLWGGSIRLLLELPEESANELLYLFGKAELREQTELFQNFKFTGVDMTPTETRPEEGRLQESVRAFGENIVEQLRQVVEVFLPSPQLKDPILMHLAEEPDTDRKDKARIKHSTSAINVGALYRRNDRAIPHSHTLYEAYNLFLLEHSLEMAPGEAGNGLINVGLQVAFEEEDDVIIVDMLPQNRFFLPDGGEGVNLIADLQVNGRLALPADSVGLAGAKEALPLGGALQLSTTDNIVGRIQLEVPTLEVTVTGIGSSVGEWSFHNPAVTSLKDTFTMTMLQLILINKTVKAIELKSRMYATATTFDALPERRTSEWVRYTCYLL